LQELTGINAQNEMVEIALNKIVEEALGLGLLLPTDSQQCIPTMTILYHKDISNIISSMSSPANSPCAAFAILLMMI